MKKNRDCGGNMYPTYQGVQAYPGPMPMPMPMMGLPMMNTGMMTNSMPSSSNNYSYAEGQIESINNRLSSLERRVSKLENTTPQVTPLNSYNDTNFYMM